MGFGGKIFHAEDGFLDFEETILDFPGIGDTITTSPPIQFRIEWAGSQEMSPLFGSRPI